jgi:hypothetical protein
LEVDVLVEVDIASLLLRLWSRLVCLVLRLHADQILDGTIGNPAVFVPHVPQREHQRNVFGGQIFRR